MLSARVRLCAGPPLGLEVRECSACLAWERDGWTFEANPMRYSFAATVLAVQSSTLGSCSSRTN
mgnify:CR=1 FL=1